MYPVSVVIPVYNESAERIRVAVWSAHAAGAAEIVVIDDGSELPPVVPQAIAPTVVSLPRHVGLARALNVGFSVARQTWIAWLSCGDIMDPRRLEKQVEFGRLTGAVAVFSDYDGDDGPVVAEDDWDARIWRDNQFSLSMALVHHLVADSVRFDQRIQYCVDWKFALEVQVKWGWRYLDCVLGRCTGLNGMTGRANVERRQVDRACVAAWASANRPWDKLWRPPCA